MKRGRVFGSIALVLVATALLGAPDAHGRHRGGGHRRRCHSDRRCKGGTCNDAGVCCRPDEITCGATCCNKLFADACCDGACVNFALDDNNCGSCANACIGGRDCQDGVCDCPVSRPTVCADGCTNVLWDDANCGSCGNACPADEKCFTGTCGCQDTTKLKCNDQCLDGFSDPNNCGSCGNVCAQGTECVGGTCQAPCDACSERVDNICVPRDVNKTLVCNGVCVDPKTDSSNCGSCGNACLGGDSCQNGICTGGGCPPPSYHSCGVFSGSTHCCLNGLTCCAGERTSACCGEGTQCAANLDAYCCPADWKICGIYAGYPCVPPDAQCPTQ